MDGSPKAPVIDPITLEVVRNKLEGIANEMQTTLLRSFVLADRQGRAWTARPALFTAEGRRSRRHARFRSISPR